MKHQTRCSRCGRPVADEQSQTVPVLSSLYACRRLCPVCSQVEGSGFGLTPVAGLLVLMLLLELIFSIFKILESAPP